MALSMPLSLRDFIALELEGCPGKHSDFPAGPGAHWYRQQVQGTFGSQPQFLM